MNVATLLKAKGDRVIRVSPETPVVVAIDRMKHNAIGALVVSANGRELQGLLSERDILQGLSKHGSKLLDLRVCDVMSQPAATCSPEDSLKHVMRQMTSKRIHHIPVLDPHCLRGIISIGDVVKYFLEEMELEVNVLCDLLAASGPDSSRFASTLARTLSSFGD